jgi:small subunit ribosomal protein S10e
MIITKQNRRTVSTAFLPASTLAVAVKSLCVFLCRGPLIMSRAAHHVACAKAKTDIVQIYEALFKEGVLVAPKDFNSPSHPDLTEIRNLEVIKAMQSLTSKGYVKTQFSWQWYYYTLTDEGLAYLREFLHLPSEIVPQTHMKPARPAGRPAGGAPREGGAYRAPRGDREYRRRDDAGDKEGAGGEYRPVSLPSAY